MKRFDAKPSCCVWKVSSQKMGGGSTEERTTLEVRKMDGNSEVREVGVEKGGKKSGTL
jgi:hypothetical protein